MYKKSFFESNIFVFLVTFLFGWITYNLKLVSLNKLLGDLTFSHYPYLILGQGLLLLITYKLFKKLAEKSEVLFYFITVASGFFTIAIPLLKSTSQIPSMYIYLFVFFMSNLLIQAYDICMRVFSTHRVSVLKKPKFSILILLSYECGTIIGSLTGLLEKILPSTLVILSQAIPFIILLIIIFLIRNIKTSSSHVVKADKKQVNFKEVPFLKLSLILFATIYILKNIQGFATILAIKSLNETSGNSLSVIFSKITIVQTVLIILFLVINYYYKKKSTNWTKGFYILLIFQIITMCTLAIFVNPIFVIGLSIGRKLLNHTIVGDAQNMFDASIPSAFRLNLKNIIQRSSAIIGLFTLSFFSFLSINNYIPNYYIWLVSAIIAIIGYFSIKKLLLRFNKYHLDQITNFQKTKSQQIPDIVNSTYALANPSAEKAYLSLLMVITQKPPLPLSRAIFYSLGEIKAEKSFKSIQRQYLKQDSEAVKSEILKTIEKNNVIEKDIFFVKSLEHLLKAQDFPFIQKNLFKSFFRINSTITKNLICKLSTDYSSKDLLSYMFYLKDEDLIKYEKYFLEIFNSNEDSTMKLLAAQNLCKIPSSNNIAIQYIAKKFNIKDSRYFINVLHVISNLELKTYLPKILKDLRKSKYSNLPMLHCALTLNYEQAAMHIIKLIRNGDPFSLPSHIKEFYYLEDKYRFQIYSAFFNYDPDFLESLIVLLIEHENDFSDDVELIYKEAQRRSIYLNPYEYLFQEY